MQLDVCIYIILHVCLNVKHMDEGRKKIHVFVES